MANYGALEVATTIVTSVELRKIQTRRFAVFNENYCQQPLQLKVSKRAIQTVYHMRSDFTCKYWRVFYRFALSLVSKSKLTRWKGSTLEQVTTVWNNTSLRKEILCHKTETDNFK